MKYSAFTLIELLVSMSIIAIMAVLSVSSYPKFAEQISLSTDTYKMLAFFRETQTFGISSLSVPGKKFANGFVFSKSSNEIKRLRREVENCFNGEFTNIKYQSCLENDPEASPAVLKDQFTISSIVGFRQNVSTELVTAYGVFKRPNPEAKLFGLEGSTNLVPSDSLSFDKLEVTLSSKKNNVFKKKVVILSTGQMYVSDW